MNSEHFLSTWMSSKNLSQFNKPHLFLMLIQTDFESLAPTDQGWSFGFRKGFSREVRTCGVTGRDVLG